MRVADLDTERGREDIQRHVKTCPICRADSTNGVADWDAANAARKEDTHNGHGGHSHTANG